MGMHPVALDEADRNFLQALSSTTGQTEAQLIHRALDLLRTELPYPERLELLRQAMGMWRDRDDLPDLSELRAKFDRD